MKSKGGRYSLVESIISDSNIRMDAQFKSQLEKKLTDSLNERSYINLFFFKMNKQIMLVVFGILVVGAVIAGTYLATGNQKQQLAQYNQVEADIPDDSNSTDAAMKIAVDEHESLSDAKEALTFTPLNLTRILGADLAGVQTARTFDGSKSDYLYLTFVKNGDSYFNLSQSKINASDLVQPEGSEDLELNVDGEMVRGYYIRYDNSDIDPNSEMYLYEGVFAADSSLSFYIDGIYVDISEYAGLSREDMKAIAESIGR
jgi:hypothetical protein